jgi:subtilisin family serine protease
MKLQVLLALLSLTFAAPAPLAPRDGTPIPGQYIVKLKSNSLLDHSILNLINDLFQDGPQNAYIKHIYNIGSFAGFAVATTDSAAQQLRQNPNVELVEQDHVIQIELDHVEEIVQRSPVTQYTTSSTWGLGRLSSKATNSGRYVYDSTAGAGICAYVIDTGIETTHPEFQGRATFLANFAEDGSNTDGHGHGTHVAGIIGSKTYGVSKRVNLFAVKVLNADGTGALSGVLAGVDFAANDAKSRGCKSSVANFSFATGKSDALNSAAANAASSGLFIAVAAGNSAADAIDTSPASEPSVFTVGSTDSNDRLAASSNYGASVDILAPGVAILSTWKSGGTAVLSGTSMATPHVTGFAAYLLAYEGIRTPAALSARMTSLANINRITGVPAGTVNLLAFNGNSRA